MADAIKKTFSTERIGSFVRESAGLPFKPLS